MGKKCVSYKGHQNRILSEKRTFPQQAQKMQQRSAAVNPLIDKEQRLRFLIKNLKSVIFAYADRHARIADALGASGWQKLKQLIDTTTTAEGEEELTHALTLNSEFVLFLKRDKLIEINLRKTLGSRGSVYLSNLIDLAM